MAHLYMPIGEGHDLYMPIEEGQQQQQTGYYGPVSNAPREVRLGFVKKVYGILFAQLLVTVVIALCFQGLSVQELMGRTAALEVLQHGKHWMWIPLWKMCLCLSYLAGVCCLTFAARLARKFPMNYCMLGLFTGAEGVVVGIVARMVGLYSTNVVLAAAGATMLIFACLSICAWTTRRDFTGFGVGLRALCGLTILCLDLASAEVELHNVGYDVQFKVVKNTLLVYTCCNILVFVSSIIFDTQMMLGEYGGHKYQFEVDDYAFAAIILYSDFFNLLLPFRSVKLFGELFGDRDRR